jgi:hypothetical protein
MCAGAAVAALWLIFSNSICADADLKSRSTRHPNMSTRSWRILGTNNHKMKKLEAVVVTQALWDNGT